MLCLSSHQPTGHEGPPLRHVLLRRVQRHSQVAAVYAEQNGDAARHVTVLYGTAHHRFADNATRVHTWLLLP